MMQDTTRLIIAGHEHRTWTRYSIDSDFFTPADGWQVELGIPPGELPGYIQPWAQCQLYMGHDRIMTGRIDNLRRQIAKDSHRLTLTGRDGAAVLLDCSAPIFVQRQVTLPEVVSTIVKPLGVHKVEVQGGVKFEKSTVEPGMTAWDALQRAAEASGLWPWFTPDGTLKVGAPDYSAPVVDGLVMRRDGKGNNILDLELANDASKRYSEVTVLGQSNGDEEDEGDNTVKATVRDKSFKGHRPLIRNEGYIDNTEKARAKARKLMADGLFHSLEITARVRGHRTISGLLWEPGQRVDVFSQPHYLDCVYFLTKRVFALGRDGAYTTLTLKPDGIWLPDTARKPRGKKKTEEDDLDE